MYDELTQYIRQQFNRAYPEWTDYGYLDPYWMVKVMTEANIAAQERLDLNWAKSRESVADVLHALLGGAAD